MWSRIFSEVVIALAAKAFCLRATYSEDPSSGSGSGAKPALKVPALKVQELEMLGIRICTPDSDSDSDSRNRDSSVAAGGGGAVCNCTFSAGLFCETVFKPRAR